MKPLGSNLIFLDVLIHEMFCILVFVSSPDPDVSRAIVDHHLALLCLSRSEAVTLLDRDHLVPPGCISINGETGNWTAHIKLKVGYFKMVAAWPFVMPRN